jgi:hypothetical protein
MLPSFISGHHITVTCGVLAQKGYDYEVKDESSLPMIDMVRSPPE